MVAGHAEHVSAGVDGLGPGRRYARPASRGELIDHGYHALDSHIVGFTLWVLPYLAITDEQGPEFARNFLTYEPIAQMPDLLDHIRWHLRPERSERHAATSTLRSTCCSTDWSVFAIQVENVRVTPASVARSRPKSASNHRSGMFSKGAVTTK